MIWYIIFCLPVLAKSDQLLLSALNQALGLASDVMNTMQIERVFQVVAATACLVLAPLATGDSQHHGAHVHGVAEMTLALEGNVLEIVFTSPAMSVVGFEHGAQSAAEVGEVVRAQEVLGNGAEFLTFSGTQCELRKAVVDVTAVWGGVELDEAGHNDHESNLAAPEDHVVDQDHEGQESHSDIRSNYTFRCEDGDELETVKVGASDLPFGLERINAMWITQSGQGATELRKGKALIAIR